MIEGALSLEFVAERGAQNPGSKRRLLDDELIGADEGARVRIGEVLAVDVEPPGILGDAYRGVDGRVSGNFEPPPRGIHGSARQHRRIRSRLRERNPGMSKSDLDERRV